MVKFWNWWAKLFLSMTEKSHNKYIEAVRSRIARNNKAIMALEKARIRLENDNAVMSEILGKNDAVL